MSRHRVIAGAPYITGTVRVFDGQVFRLTARPERPAGHRAVWVNVVTGEHREPEVTDDDDHDLQCVCIGQGGTIYMVDCPIHDHSVDTDDAHWRLRYENHLTKERVGW
jgi:hypothetical protein